MSTNVRGSGLRSIIYALFLCMVLAIVLYWFGYLLTSEKNVGLAGVTAAFGAFIKIHPAVEKGRFTLLRSTWPEGVVPLEGFMLPWYLMFLYGLTILVALPQAFGFVAGILGAQFGLEGQDVIALLASGSVFLIPVIGYFLGVWLGVRCDKLAIPVVVALAVMGRVVGVTIDFLIVPSTAYEAFVGVPKSFTLFLLSILSGVILLVPLGLIGIWRGRQLRLSRYVYYLLNRIEGQRRKRVVAMVYEEARTSPSSQTQGTQRTP